MFGRSNFSSSHYVINTNFLSDGSHYAERLQKQQFTVDFWIQICDFIPHKSAFSTLLFSPLFSPITWKPGLRGFSKEFQLQLTKSSSADDHTITQRERERENICITIKPIVRKTALLIEDTQLSLLELTDGDQTESISYICFQDTAVTERRMSRHKKG